MDKENTIYIIFILDYYSVFKRTTWMNLENIIVSEIRQIQKDKYYMILIRCGISKESNS